MKSNYHSNIILFDGVCNLCNGFVQFIIRHDKNETIYFGSLQSDEGQTLLNEYKIDSDKVDSIVFISQNKAFIKSDAIFKIIQHLSFPWKSLVLFKILPKRLNDKLYEIIAKSRYRVFGKEDSCWVPTSKLKTRFIS